MSQFSLAHALNRFLPRAGKAAARMTLSAYLVSLVAALLTSTVYVLFVEFWTPALGFLRSSLTYAFGFVAATMICCVFALQDGAFVGLRKAGWVPIENFAFSLLKIALLIAFAGLLPDIGIFASWAVAMAVMVIPVNLLIFAYLAPRHTPPEDTLQEPSDIRTISKFVLGDYSASLIGNLPYFIFPLIVLEKFGASANAYYYMSWTITYSLYLVGQNIGMSLIAEASRNQGRLGMYSYQSLIQGARLLIPAVLFLILVAPYVLGLFGADYSTEGTSLFRLLCLTAVPNLIVALFIGVARVRRRMGELTLVNGARSALMLVLSFPLMELHGIEGVGVAILVSSSLIAVGLIAARLGRMWLPYVNLRPLVALAGRARSYRARREHEVRSAQATQVLSELTDHRRSETHLADAHLWTVLRQLASINDVSAFALQGRDEEPVALLKIARSAGAAASLDRHASALERLRAEPGLSTWSVRVPEILATGRSHGRAYLIESYIPGDTASQLIASPLSRQSVQRSAVDAIGFLHQRTAREMVLDESWMEQWVAGPARRIGEHMSTHFEAGLLAESLDRLVGEMNARLRGETAIVSWVHGDYSPGNIVIDADGRRVIGILDWECAQPNGLPCIDIVSLVLSALMVVENRELGDVVVDLLECDTRRATDTALIEQALSSCGPIELAIEDLVLLCWLNHVDSNLRKATRYAASEFWKSKNIVLVLHRLADSADVKMPGRPAPLPPDAEAS